MRARIVRVEAAAQTASKIRSDVKPDVAIGLGALVVVGLLIAWAMGWIG